MKILSLKRKGNNILITLDDNSDFLIDYRTFVDFRIHKDVEISIELMKLLSQESSFVKCKDSAFRFLARRLHSTKELKLKLQKKNYSKEIIDKTIFHLNEQNYLNDEEFALQFVKEKISRGKIGINKIVSELKNKGINNEITQKIISSIDNNTFNDNKNTLIKKKLNQLKNKETDKRKIKQKIISHLISKGYDYDSIYNSLKNFDLAKEE